MSGVDGVNGADGSAARGANGVDVERRDAHARLGRRLSHAVRGVLILAVVAWLVPGVVGRGAGWAVVGALIVAPVARIAWFAVRWWRLDRRFVPVALALIATLAVAAVVALLVG